MGRKMTKKSWTRVSSKAKAQWSEVTDSELQEIDGDYDKLVSKLQDRYGYEQARAQKEADLFFKENQEEDQ